MLRIGITGGIGSGKSTVCQVFQTLGISVYNADAETKNLYETHAPLRQGLINLFGESIYEGNQLNRKALAGIVFNNAEALQKLNNLVHPLVIEHYEDWCTLHATEPYTLKEAAILFESGTYKQLHFVIGVIAPDELRINRTMQRDGLSRDEVLLRMQKQLPTETLIKRCDYTIINDGTQSITEQVLTLHKTFLAMQHKPLPAFKG